MKKILINIILLFTFSISGMAQIEYGKTVAAVCGTARTVV